jgi:hypothetical protein
MSKPFKTKDAALSFLVGQLDAFDPKFHEPLFEVSWGRDVDLRTDVDFGNESASFLRSNFSGGGTLTSSGLPWISAETTAIQGVTLNGERTVLPVRPLAREISFSSIELARASKLGQNLETMKMNALNNLYQLNTDQMVYIGAAEVGATGLVNSPLVTVTAVPNGVGGSPLWANKTPAEILADVNAAITTTWAATGYSVMPRRILLPPAKLAYLSSQLISTAGSASILKFLKDNAISNEVNGQPMEFFPCKWLTGRGTSGTDRMVVYTKAEDRVRFPLVPIRRETAYYQGIKFVAPYIWAYGSMELIYPETMQYIDGI